MTHAELVLIGIEWLKKPYVSCKEYGHSSCSVVISELVTCTTYGEIPDVLGYTSGKQKTILIECKTSYSDFIADQNKPFRKMPKCGMGDQRWYLAEKGIIPVEKVPENWGLLEITNDGKIASTNKCALFQEKNYRNEINLLISAICRLHVSEPDECIGVRYYHSLNFAGKESKKKASITIGG
jgi:hypothetical protein